jgi:hypothetical protein
MAKAWELLDKTYLLINAGFNDQARQIVRQVISRDPQNIEAWEIYIGTIDKSVDLEKLKEVVDIMWESGARENDYLEANRNYILRRIDERITNL